MSDDHVPDINHRGWMLRPFLITNTMGLFDVAAHVHGGGKSGQAQAIRHGIARALQLYEPSFRWGGLRWSAFWFTRTTV